ncbi:MAG: redoxin domain-containing protein, partial [Gammaproteobacteria bacterium]
MVQLDDSLPDYAEAGLGVVAISYDSVEILSSFDERMGGIDFPMIADPESEIIGAYGIRNPNPAAGTRHEGMAFPGTY